MKRFLKRVVCFALCVALMTATAAAATYQPSFSLSAKRVLLLNLDSNMTIYEKDADEPIEPSLLAQMMTAILVIEQIDDLDNTMLSMSAVVQDEMYTKNIELDGIRLSGLYKGEQISARKLLYSMIVRDANDAAMMFAEYLGDGSIKYFTELMNKRAAELGATHTNFTNPTGLADTDSYTTARDVAIIAQYAITLPVFEEMMNTTFYDGGPTSSHDTLYWNTTNKLLVSSSDYYNSAVQGIKTGWHDDLGSYAVTLARKNGYTYLAVVMGCSAADETEAFNAAFTETNQLYQWAFQTFSVKTLLEKGKSFGELPLRLGANSKDFLRVMAADNFMALIPTEIEVSSIRYDLRLPASVNAPVEEGDLIGEVHLILADEEIGVVAVVASESAAASNALQALDRITSLMRTFWFKFAVVFIVLLVALYVAATIVRNRSRSRYGMRGRRY
jgi:D-alanyl-D-alanine carboxypeptidase